MSDKSQTPDVDPLNAEPVVRRRMTMIYMIDTSSSMSGTKIGTVNNTMTETIPEIRGIGGADSEVYVNVITFDDTANWMCAAPVNIETFKWNDVGACGMTSLGAACREVSSKLSKKEFLNSPHLSYAPVLILMSDGAPNDDFYGGLEVLRRNKWFQSAIKVAIAIGDDADKDVLAEFTGDRELVIEVHSPDDLKRVIRFVSVTSSQIGSQSVGVAGSTGTPITPQQANQAKQSQMVSQIQQFKQTSGMSAKDVDYDDWERSCSPGGARP